MRRPQPSSVTRRALVVSFASRADLTAAQVVSHWRVRGDAAASGDTQISWLD